MFEIFTSTDKLERLQDLALPHAIDKVLRDASKLSLRLSIDVYFYNFSGNREIKKASSIDFVDEKLNFLVMQDDRIAIKGTECLSAIVPLDQAVNHFKFLNHQIGLTIHRDKTGLYYYEKRLLPYNIIKENMTTFGNTSKWSDNDWQKYFDLWTRCPSLREYASFHSFHLVKYPDLPCDNDKIITA
jgi:hypothetical protein